MFGIPRSGYFEDRHGSATGGARSSESVFERYSIKKHLMGKVKIRTLFLQKVLVTFSMSVVAGRCASDHYVSKGERPLFHQNETCHDGE